MTSPLAILVEDDDEQSAVSDRLLREAGFNVQCFESIETVLEYLRDCHELIDLFVLDRRLPVRFGERATDEFGDELLDQIRNSFPDARILIFTGFATIRHVQQSLKGSGQLPALASPPLDRITVLEKDQSLEFKEHVVVFRALLQELEDIELVILPKGTLCGPIERRVLRRVGLEHGAVTLSAVALSGGLTGASVWKCDLERAEGGVGSIVVKQVWKASSLGGLSELLPRANSTSTVATLSGLMGGTLVNILQLAGDAPYPLMDILQLDPHGAAGFAQVVFVGLSAVPEKKKIVTISEICNPFGSWSELSGLLDERGIRVPSGSLRVTTRIGMRHGDLHPGNILIDDNDPVIIDFDNSGFAAGLIDPLTLYLSTLVHPDSPIGGNLWPLVSEIEASFGQQEFAGSHAQHAWFDSTFQWVEQRQTSSREFWAVVLGYCARQLKYEGITGSPPTLERIIALARKASDQLAVS